MYMVAGATGRVGSGVASRLLAAGAHVRTLTRDARRGAAWAERGAEVVAADLADRDGLAAALQGSRGAFLLLPFDVAAPDPDAASETLRAAIAGAVADSGVPHVVLLSSIGAELPSGTGPIVQEHHLENQLRATGTTLTAIRPPHFQEKVADLLDVARAEGIYPVFGPADVEVPMVATADVGAVAAAALLDPPSTHEAIDLDAPAYTEREVAAQLGQALGRDLEVAPVPQAHWTAALGDAGFSPRVAQQVAELYEAAAAGRLVPRGDRSVRCETDLAVTLAEVVGAARAGVTSSTR